MHRARTVTGEAARTSGVPSIRCIGRTVRRNKSLRERVIHLLLAATLAFHLLPATALAQAGDRVAGTSPARLGISKKALPAVGMEAGLLVTDDGRELWSRHVDDRRAMASITKIMTAIVALENSQPQEIVTISAKAKATGDSSTFLKAGQKLPMSELLEGLLVKSSNDAAAAIAEHIAGDEDRFVARMNQKAAELGLTRTHYTNSHGLDEKDHYSSAADIAVLSRYAMRDERFRAIVGKSNVRVGSSEPQHNTNLLIGTYDGANGVKTGWTNDAGYCLVASAKRGRIELYAIVLGTPGDQSRHAQARELLDWGFAHYREQKLSSARTIVGESVVLDYVDVTVPGAMAIDTRRPVFDLNGPITRSVTMAEVHAPVRAGDRIGVATFTQRDKVIASVPLVATTSVDKPNPFERIGIAMVRVWRRFTGSTVVAQPGPGIATPN